MAKNVYDLKTVATDVMKEVIGTENLKQENLTNVVDMGKMIQDMELEDKYFEKLIARVAKLVVTNKLFTTTAPSIMKDTIEFGTLVEHIEFETIDPTDSIMYNRLNDGQSYDPNIYHQSKFSVKIYDYEDSIAFTWSKVNREQIKTIFSDENELMVFLGGIDIAVRNSISIQVNAFIMRVINSLIADTVASEIPDASYSTKTALKAVNLLKLYNDANGKTLTASNCLYDLDFLKFASYKIGVDISRLKQPSVCYNVEKKLRQTGPDALHVVLLNDFATASDVYLQSSTYHNELTKLPNYETVPCWQALKDGDAITFDAVSKINVTTGSKNTVVMSGILGVVFDEKACAVTLFNESVRSQYNAPANFTNYWYDQKVRYMNDLSQNCIVYFVA